MASDVTFGIEDLRVLTALVSDAWQAGSGRDWSAPAGTLEWSCAKTADHAVDTVFAPAFFLASRRQDRYPDMGAAFTVGPDPRPHQLVEALGVASRVLAAVVAEADPTVRAVLFRRPNIIVAPPKDFVPRAATELILHGHDVCAGLGVRFEPSAELCEKLREHTRSWMMWSFMGDGLPRTADPWGDLLAGSGRRRIEMGQVIDGNGR